MNQKSLNPVPGLITLALLTGPASFLVAAFYWQPLRHIVETFTIFGFYPLICVMAIIVIFYLALALVVLGGPNPDALRCPVCQNVVQKREATALPVVSISAKEVGDDENTN